MAHPASFYESLLAALEVAVLLRSGVRRFQAVAIEPAWFEHFRPGLCGGGDLAADSPFLDNFLVDAEAFWAGGTAGRIGSGLWAEGDGAGEQRFEAFAVRAGQLDLLLISRLPDAEYVQRQQVFQVAREAMLRAGERTREPGRGRRHDGDAPAAPAVPGDGGAVLPNRALFEERVTRHLGRQRGNDASWVLMVGIDRVDDLRARMGEAGAQLLLQLFAARLWTCVRESDVVARCSDAEFAVLLPLRGGAQDAALDVVAALRDVLRPPFDCGPHQITVTASIGGALCAGEGGDPALLLARALAALRWARARGGNDYRFDDEGVEAGARRRLGLDRDLRRALENGEFVVHYHPRVDLKSRRIVGMEALVRWQVPGRGLAAPAEFVPFAEQTGLIVPIGEWVLRSACRQLRDWQRGGLSGLVLSVNVSVRQLERPGLVDTVRDVLGETGLEPASLELEITESSLMTDVEHCIGTMQALRDLGVGLSIDDFGTGYSSLGYLKRLPLDVLKIDRSFIQDLAVDSTDAAIVAAILTVARHMKLRTVAEGVTDEMQLGVLGELECDELQGFLFSRPLAAPDFLRLMQQTHGLAVVVVPGPG